MNAEPPGEPIGVRTGRARRKATRPLARVNQLGQAIGPKGHQTRQRLLDATSALLETTKIRDLQVANIARAAQTSPATFYVYFNDVTAAVLTLIGEVTQSTPNLLSLLASSWGSQGDYACAHAFVSGYVEHWRTHAAMFRVRNLASDEGDQRFTELRIHAISSLIEGMARRIEQRQQTGALISAVQAVSVAGALLALIERIAVLKLAPPNYGVTRETLVDAASFFSILVMGEGDAVSAMPALSVQEPPNAPIPVEARAEFRTSAQTTNKQGQLIGPKGANTRNRILEATDSLVRVRGLREFSIKDIADLAKVSTSAFYLYFEDVADALLCLTYQESPVPPRLMEIVSGDATRPDLAAEALEFIALYVEYWLRHAALFRVRNLAADEGDERFIRARSEAVRPLLVAIAERIAERQACGALPAGLHPFSTAGALLAMIERLCATPSVGSVGRVTRATLNQAAAYFLSVLLAGA